MAGEGDKTAVATDSSIEEGTSSATPPTRPAPPKLSKIPPPPSDDPPPYSSSYHAQSSGLLGSRQAAVRTSTQATNNRASRTLPGYRRYTALLTKRNLCILASIVAFLICVALALAWLSGSEESSEDYYAPTLAPSSSHHASDRVSTQPLEIQWKLLGAFKELEQRMAFDEMEDAIILSKYFPEDHLLKCEKLLVDKPRNDFIYTTHNVSQIYEDCARFTDDVICCSTSPHGHNHRTDCYLNMNGEVVKSVASHYDFMHNWQSLADDNKLLLLFNRQGHAVLNLRTKRIHRIEENRLPHNYVSVAFFFPLDNQDELDELVRNGEEFRVCEYKQTLSGDYALQAPECRTTPFHVEYELPKVRFCSNPLYTAVVQYGHLSDEKDLTFHIKVDFLSSSEVYAGKDSLETPYEELVIDCNDETIEVYVLGKYEVARFSVRLPNLHSEHFIQNRI